jgi:HK97 family phage major capsid protein
MSKHIVRAHSGLLALSVAYFGPVFMDALASLEERLETIEAESITIRDLADTEERDFSDEETEKVEANALEIEKLKRQIAARKLITPTAGPGRKTKPEVDNKGGKDGDRRVPATVRDNARHNFLNLGEFALSVRSQKVGDFDNEGVKKLQNAATTYGNEGTGADGGFLVPPEFANEIWKKVDAEENLMSRCTELVTGSNSMSIPKDELTPWGSSGIQFTWEGEAAQVGQTKGVFENSTLRLYKLMALAPVSDEMLEDSRGFESWLMAKVPGLLSAKINTAIVSGTGAGQPLGILNSPSLVSVAKQTSQPADTVWMKNIENMWARMYAPWRRNAVWLINQDIEPSLGGMAFQAVGASSDLPGTSAVPAYLPPGGLSGSAYGTLKGRPVVPIQAAKTVGDQGDIILVDLKQYWVLRKAAGMRSDTSIHLYFDQAVTAFRFIFRMNGQPAWSSSISPQNGSNTLSWAVALDAR